MVFDFIPSLLYDPKILTKFMYTEIHWPLQFATFSNFGKDIDASYTDQRGYLYLAMAVRLGCVKLA